MKEDWGFEDPSGGSIEDFRVLEIQSNKRLSS